MFWRQVPSGHYVWTRDHSLCCKSGDLLWFDPERARNSLEFKISDKKSIVGGGGNSDRSGIQEAGGFMGR